MATLDTDKLNRILDPADLFGARAGQRASDIQSELANLGLDLEKDFFRQLRQDEAPVRETRNQALAFLDQLRSGEAVLPRDPGLDFRQDLAITDINKFAKARGRTTAGDTFFEQQNQLAQLEGESTQNALNRILNLAGFQTQDLLGSNQLIEQGTDAIINQQANISAIDANQALGRRNSIFNAIGQGAQIAGAVFPQQGR